MKKNWLTTLGGIMAGLGTLPLLATAAHVSLPLWWNECQFPLFLSGAVGTILIGVAAKGQDEHSSVAQVQAATIQEVASDAVKQADAPPSVTQVSIVPPRKPE